MWCHYQEWNVETEGQFGEDVWTLRCLWNILSVSPGKHCVKLYFHDVMDTYCVKWADAPFPRLSSLHYSCECGPQEVSWMRQESSSSQITFTLQRLELDIRCYSYTPIFYLLTHLGDNIQHQSLYNLILPQDLFSASDFWLLGQVNDKGYRLLPQDTFIIKAGGLEALRDWCRFQFIFMRQLISQIPVCLHTRSDN